MNKMVLHDYSGIITEANIDIPENDIIAMIKYVDHGDEWLVVRTKDETYKYGWFLSSRGYPDYDELTRCTERYVGENKLLDKAPKLYFKYDSHFNTSNEICFMTDDLIEKWGRKNTTIWDRAGRYDHYTNPEKAFDRYCEDVEEQHSLGYAYHCPKYREDQLLAFLAKNDLVTEENLNKLAALKTFWRFDEIDGLAGVRKVADCITGDKITWAWYKGEEIDPKTIRTTHMTERSYFGNFDMFRLDLKRFCRQMRSKMEEMK